MKGEGRVIMTNDCPVRSKRLCRTGVPLSPARGRALVALMAPAQETDSWAGMLEAM
jgi:hypothetical protein